MKEGAVGVRGEAPGTGDMAMGTKGVLGQQSLPHRLASGQSCCPLLLSPSPVCFRGSPMSQVGGTGPHPPSHCRSGRPW